MTTVTMTYLLYYLLYTFILYYSNLETFIYFISIQLLSSSYYLNIFTLFIFNITLL